MKWLPMIVQRTACVKIESKGYKVYDAANNPWTWVEDKVSMSAGTLYTTKRMLELYRVIGEYLRQKGLLIE